MDVSAVLNASERILEQLGLTKAGDRLNLTAFCKSAQENNGRPGKPQEDTTTKKKALLEAFLSRKKIKKTSNDLKPVQEKKEKIKTRKVHLGWKHFREEDDAYFLVPLSKGGGSRTVDVPVTSSKVDLYLTCKNLFFPNGESLFGKADDMVMNLTNFKDEKIGETITVGDCVVPFNINNYMEAHKMKTVRLYLQSKRLFTDHDSDVELNQSAFIIDNDMPPIEVNEGTSLIDSSEDREALVQEQDEAYEISLQMDRKKKAELEFRSQEEKRKERLQRARIQRVLPEPNSSFVTVKIRHPSLGLQSRKFPMHTLMYSVYDWAGSLSTEPEHFTLNDPLGTVLPPSRELHDRNTLTMIESPEGTPSLLTSDDEIEFWGFGQAVDTSADLSGWFADGGNIFPESQPEQDSMLVFCFKITDCTLLKINGL